jgi:hypothetical protein
MSSCSRALSGCKRWHIVLGGMSGLSSGLEHGGHQMLGEIAKGYLLRMRG